MRAQTLRKNLGTADPGSKSEDVSEQIQHIRIHRIEHILRANAFGPRGNSASRLLLVIRYNDGWVTDIMFYRRSTREYLRENIIIL